MTQQEINENNALIANFMEAKPCKKHPDKQCFLRIKDNKNPSIQYWHLLKYYSDWSWLMPVVDKIEKLDGLIDEASWAKKPYSFKIEAYGVQIEIDRGISDTPFEYCSEEPKLEATYKAAVKFIKWFNENK